MNYPQIDPVAIQLGPIAIHWYGLMYLAAFVGCGLLISRRARRADLPLAPGLISDLINSGALGVILGGRLGYMLFYDLQAWIQDPLKVLRIWDGGMSFHGGLIGVVLALVLFARKHNESIIRVGDLIAPTVPLGLMFGRIGNFIGGELRSPTDSPLGMIFPHVDEQLRHPSQLYQAAGEGLVLFALCMWFAVNLGRRAKWRGISDGLCRLPLLGGVCSRARCPYRCIVDRFNHGAALVGPYVFSRYSDFCERARLAKDWQFDESSRTAIFGSDAVAFDHGDQRMDRTGVGTHSTLDVRFALICPKGRRRYLRPSGWPGAMR